MLCFGGIAIRRRSLWEPEEKPIRKDGIRSCRKQEIRLVFGFPESSLEHFTYAIPYPFESNRPPAEEPNHLQNHLKADKFHPPI
jgi:hypothetical protein